MTKGSTKMKSTTETKAGRQARPTRRVFSTAYKLRILAEADRCDAKGEMGSLLRREGLYSSHLTNWRAQRELGSLKRTRGRGPAPRQSAEEKELERLRRRNAKLEASLSRAEKIIAAQKKLSEILESFSLNPESSERE
jgi:transposase-like protein